MSDHFSGPRALADPAADLTDLYAFPAPDNPQRLVVVMDVFGKAGPGAVFSDAVIYRFRFRRARIAMTRPGAAFGVDPEEVGFDITGGGASGGDTALQLEHCRTPSAKTVSV